MIEIGSKVRSLLLGEYLNLTGIVLTLQADIPWRIAKIKVENPQYPTGHIVYFYEKDLDLIRSLIDPAFLYQYCNKCNVLTSNKNNLCCDHKPLQAVLINQE